jgi:tRNA threonylcarbamoyladenosine modification (KEOPS) complex  Pcc1 subunit
MKKYTCSLSIGFDTQKEAEDSYKALVQEADFAHRGGSKVKKGAKKVDIQIACEDPVALRATINSYLRLMQILKTVDGVE